MIPRDKPGAILDPDHPEIGFDIMTGEWVFNASMKIQLKEKIIQVISLKVILRDCFIGSLAGFAGGKIAVLFGSSSSVIKYITLGGCLVGFIVGCFDKVDKKVQYNPLVEGK